MLDQGPTNPSRTPVLLITPARTFANPGHTLRYQDSVIGPADAHTALHQYLAKQPIPFYPCVLAHRSLKHGTFPLPSLSKSYAPFKDYFTYILSFSLLLSQRSFCRYIVASSSGFFKGVPECVNEGGCLCFLCLHWGSFPSVCFVQFQCDRFLFHLIVLYFIILLSTFIIYYQLLFISINNIYCS